MSIFKVGDKVGTGGDSQARSVRRTRGRVVEVNTSDDEVGVKFGAASHHDEVTTWFRPSELEAGSSLHAHACAPIAPGTGFPCGQSILSDYRATRRRAFCSRGRSPLFQPVGTGCREAASLSWWGLIL